MIFSTFTLPVLGLAAICNAHVFMNTPPTYANSKSSSPLDPTGSNYPCQIASGGTLTKQGDSTSMALGSTQPLSFTGSAVHGGGSCQISITYDAAPNKNSVFKVLHSIVGGCPEAGIAGNFLPENAARVIPEKYSFKIPDNIPTGEATLAWSWVNKIGNREFYMNCAPVTITAATSKRDDDLESRNVTQLVERDNAGFNALPSMFLANVGSVDGGCKTIEGDDTNYPNPGQSVEFLGSTKLKDTVECGVNNVSGSPAAAPVSQAPSSSSAAPSVPGGVFATTGATPATTLATSVVPAVSPAPVESKASPIASSAPVASGTTDSSGALTGPCTNEGTWNCISSTSFQRCASGSWSVAQQVAAGTKCTVGQSAVINITATKKRRSMRFTNDHVHRHVHHNS